MSKITKYEIAGKKVIVTGATILEAGKGRKSIQITLMEDFNEEIKRFNTSTTNMPAIDKAKDLEDLQEKNEAVFELIKDQIESEIQEWLIK